MIWRKEKKTTNKNHSYNQCASLSIKYLTREAGGRGAASPSVLPRWLSSGRWRIGGIMNCNAAADFFSLFFFVLLKRLGSWRTAVARARELLWVSGLKQTSLTGSAHPSPLPHHRHHHLHHPRVTSAPPCDPGAFLVPSRFSLLINPSAVSLRLWCWWCRRRCRRPDSVTAEPCERCHCWRARRGPEAAGRSPVFAFAATKARGTFADKFSSSVSS